MAEVLVREPTVEDAETVGRMHHAAWVEAFTPLLPEGYFDEAGEARRIEDWRRNLAAPDGTVQVRIASRDGAVVGVAAVGPAREHEGVPPARDLALWLIYIRASEYGTGLASRLLDAVLPPGPAELWVFEANPRALVFYRRHGLVPDGARHVLGAELNHQPEIRLVR